MYICICKGITDSQIREAVCSGASSLRSVRQQLGAMTQCGKCAAQTRQLVNETISEISNADAGANYYSVA
ncbi:bacterioferritin-associated ferredoxin [Sessilibacter corallicola]|uniref:Bacterioferritin-associated ferredoxin n=1 Tax=Sessilibacter corallicola TaxID=2904075 RepID=A0ABQ0A405_9GAMM|nr:bacterioferritin-associated ferredoxin [Sessilibacter corallicola]MCE2027000.1 bacterioferritin-associated ferredoxin [Sessilibacter corallicola]